MTNQCKSYQLEIIRKALSEILDSHPSRRTYTNGDYRQKSYKLYGWKADLPVDEQRKMLVSRVIKDCDNLETNEIKDILREKTLPWE
jgi:pyruvate/2-oxoglutarate dehydrogenase complex dihydrolipoamide acyltransferase (E2) component